MPCALCCELVRVCFVRTCIEGVCVFGAAAGPQTLQPVVCDLQHKPTVHHTVGGLQVAVGDDDAVVEEGHSLPLGD